MGRRALPAHGQTLVAEAARIICEEAVLDYRDAKLKAAQRLGLGDRAKLPDNVRVERAVIEYQRLFGGSEYAAMLNRRREVAVQAMRLLADFQPRLVGAVTSGAINRAHRVQLHLFCDAPELVEIFLSDRGIRVQQADRSYRFADGTSRLVPLARFSAGAVGLDAALFGVEGLKRAPLSRVSGEPMRRLDLAQAELLARQSPGTVLAGTRERPIQRWSSGM